MRGSLNSSSSASLQTIHFPHLNTLTCLPLQVRFQSNSVWYYIFYNFFLFSKIVTEKCHPFRKEIGALIDNPPEHSFWTSFTKEDTSKDCMWVDSSLQLRELANKLAEQNVFAVDTEQQNLRSYLGFTALMQVTTLLINVYNILSYLVFCFDVWYFSEIWRFLHEKRIT